MRTAEVTYLIVGLLGWIDILTVKYTTNPVANLKRAETCDGLVRHQIVEVYLR